jgi:hypothetical protein
MIVSPLIIGLNLNISERVLDDEIMYDTDELFLDQAAGKLTM